MSVNSFGRLLRVTTWGESHGSAIGAVVDGCPPGIELREEHIQPWLDRRRPGTSRYATQRRELDLVRILSGTFDGRTTGTPISLVIDNVDDRSKDYEEIAEAYRPGHADYVYEAKYGLRDWRGGGRSSARETAMRVAAGAIARRIIPELTITAYLVELGGDPINRAAFDSSHIDATPFFSPDAAAAQRWADRLDAARKDGDSLGAVAECVVSDMPPGWGAPVYGKLDSDLAAALMSINAVKGVEVGDGFASARATGRENADEMRAGEGGRPAFLANHAGGVLGGISTGQDLVVRAAFKPTSSIPSPLRTVDRSGTEMEIRTTGRHDPCVGLRGVPVVEAMVALTLADHKLLHEAQCG
jgi:chorismate synthase